ncbi:GntR family transcriptional regulator [Pseudooceanicola sp. CBS1P-1]|uniref:GntR family transcriptional regulator n=1 Tax=Pseudooceanicola albus TaxID=2692189 RepID=A0A6L7G7V2_9RHOB|nr:MULTISPECIES: GntR family transcriptional regulator [Pseudooceanicola]MBT9386173.1 GntR family transcriptional regulator [Pseudooceanicola endophyticus]MXN19410.1 GntR family transcriptional regulator [Pseudooceanicola albus]
MQETATDRVINYIRSAGLTAGDRLPAEIVLSQILGLSRNSVREAYADLLAKGMLIRRRGVGTFVAEPPIINSMAAGTGFWRLIEQSCMIPGLTELERGPAPPPVEVAGPMGLEEGQKIDRMRWLFRANGTPCVLIDHYIAPQIPLAAFEPESGPNALLALRDHIVIEGAQLITSACAVNATHEIGGLLQLPEGEAILAGTATVRSGDGRVLLASRSWYNSRIVNNRQTLNLTAMHFLPATATTTSDMEHSE